MFLKKRKRQDEQNTDHELAVTPADSEATKKRKLLTWLFREKTDKRNGR